MDKEIKQLAAIVGNSRYCFRQTYIVPDDYRHIIEDLLSGNPTYYIKGGTQCKSYANRSVIDIIRTVWHYFPAVTIKDIIKYLAYKLKKYEVSAFYCPDVRKIVICASGFYGSGLNYYGNSKGSILSAQLLKYFKDRVPQEIFH